MVARPPPALHGAEDLRVVGLFLCSQLGRHTLLLPGDEVHPLAASAQLPSEM